MILWYMQGTLNFLIHYSLGGTPLLMSFTNSNWFGDLDDHKYTIGYVFSPGSRPVTWDCKKQHALTLLSI
jgi:hypothetical protein